MRSLATLGGVLVVLVLAIAWKISNQVEATQEDDKQSGRITLGVESGQANRPGDSRASTERDGEPAAPTGSGASAQPGPAAAEEPGAAAAPPAAEPGPKPPAGIPAGGAGTAEKPAPPQPEPKPSPPPVTEQEIPGLRYTVQDGDTLYRILVRAYGTANQALIDSVAVASDLDDPSALRPGMILVLPTVPGQPEPQQP